MRAPQAGACFGLSAAACRTGFLLAARTSWLAAPAGLGASAAFTSSGFMIQVLVRWRPQGVYRQLWFGS